MRVAPEGVGAAELGVGEGAGRVPALDLRPPADAQAVDPQAVVENEARPHRDRAGGQDAEPEEAGRDGLEVVGVGEEGKDPLRRVVQHLLGPQHPHPPEGPVTLRRDADGRAAGRGGPRRGGGGSGGGHGGEGSPGAPEWIRDTDLCGDGCLQPVVSRERDAVRSTAWRASSDARGSERQSPLPCTSQIDYVILLISLLYSIFGIS